MDVLRKSFRDDLQQKLLSKANVDKDSKLGAYVEVNPRCITPNLENMFELDRITITRYRSGSHNLMIEKGRFIGMFKAPRNERLCSCNLEVQTLRHCLLVCPLLHDLREMYDITSVEQAMSNPDIADFLYKMETTLKL